MARRHTASLLAAGLVAAAALAARSNAHADGPSGEKQERCAIRLANAFLGAAPAAALMTSADPQSEVMNLMTSPTTKGLFLERFARFANAQMNVAPGVASVPDQDATYYTAYRVLDEDRKWEELFIGKFDVHRVTDGSSRIEGYTLKPATVIGGNENDGTINCGKTCTAAWDDANGLGYFRSNAWIHRYAGNEQNGVKLVTANRIMQNVIGLHLVAVTNVPDGTDITATGREAAACRGCHYDSPYALDKIASVLSVRNTKAGHPSAQDFLPPKAGSVEVLGTTITDDASFVNALVHSEAFPFNTCRLAFQFLYGRPENTCEAPLFDQCVDAFVKSGKMQDALTTLAKDPGFCE